MRPRRHRGTRPGVWGNPHPVCGRERIRRTWCGRIVLRAPDGALLGHRRDVLVSVSEAVDTEPTRTTGRRKTWLGVFGAIGTGPDVPNGDPVADDPDQLVAITRVHALAAAGAVGREE